MSSFRLHLAGKTFSLKVGLALDAQGQPYGCQLTATDSKDDFTIIVTGSSLAVAVQNLSKKIQEGTTKDYVHQFLD